MSNPIGIPQDVLNQLDPEYREFILSSGMTAQPPINESHWSPAFREPGPPVDRGSSQPMEVGSKRTIERVNYSLQVMSPLGERPGRGWLVILYAHRGGWVLGDAGAEDELLSRLCVDVECVTVSVDYRLAPEHPFPAGLDDVWDALVWLSKEGNRELGIDPWRIAVMGGSAGGNLAAVVT
ncbi:unnamed protein product [Rhizoctonia solani]|uniref:Alpha/beta hydrolase fold-3 domain-containing protein n=1 Tax=Rhizoctonia solani TaxID=456999 RepID=A0A8H3CNA9_9AGAM|nr:unnamed protein product [Rhizoctonia solani]